MHILAGWDNDPEAQLLQTFLGVEHDVEFTTTGDDFLAAIDSGRTFDVILMSINLPDIDSGYQLFQRVHERFPQAPILGACSPSDIFRIVRFMANGMNAYVIRDMGGDYVFMLQSILESTVEAVLAARDQELARKLREEIESVRRLQASVIPRHLEAPPGYEICGRYEPSQIRVLGGQPVTMAGGDYYDVFTLPDNNIVLLVGDASGHGMKACMSIMTMHTLVRMIRTQQYTDTAQFVREINNQLCEQSIVSEEGGFITLLYGILNIETNELQWSAAGHQAPILLNLDTGEIGPVADADAGGLPLAVMEEADYDSYSLSIPENCRLLLYTDGLEEAFPDNSRGDIHDQFGIDGITRSLLETAELPLEESLSILFDASSEHTQGSGRHD
ncbi:MAG: fused response regulator/phosphatase, partial [Planctomycetaceae bacterium]